ncbi:MAG: hypothetical protein CFE45_37285 [Burkholderiales bacterium PBB5]|nr:MAG: hypothetical protein CFE45_37285 [Burkholderiales bacterium PBB5]
MGTSVVSLAQPAVGQAFPRHLAGRALSAFNLMIFAGVFAIQWGIGLAIDALRRGGMDAALAYRWAMGGYGAACALAFMWLHLGRWQQRRTGGGERR